METHETQRDYRRLLIPIGIHESEGDYWRIMIAVGIMKLREANGEQWGLMRIRETIGVS